MRTVSIWLAGPALLGIACAQANPPTKSRPARQQPSALMAQAAAGYAAKITASAIFISGRELESVLAQELAPTRPLEALIRPLLRFDIDREAKRVTCRLGSASATAVCRSGFGCSLVPDGLTAAAVQQLMRGSASPLAPGPEDQSDTADATPSWLRIPTAAELQTRRSLQHAAVQKAIDRAFVETDHKRKVHTRAVVVVQAGEVLAERYADGLSAETSLPGWSMSKTLSNALIGMRVHEGKLRLDQPGLEPTEGQARQDTLPTVEHLLTMTAGLAWNEDYDNPGSDALRMLFGSADHARVYRTQPQAHVPGTVFQYASGATNQLCWLLRRSFGPDGDADYWRYPSKLFKRLGMQTAVLEADSSGTFVGSSYGYASARDWARLGLLFLRDGVVNGERLLPEGWLAASTQAAPASSGKYGYQLWLNADADAGGTRTWPELPATAFHMDGHEGQYCVMFPDADLIVVRLGCTKSGGFDLRRLLRDVYLGVTTNGDQK